MTDVLRAAKRAAKAAKNSMICSLCNQLDKARKANNGSIPYGALTKLVLKAKEAAPDLQITRYDIDNYRRKLEAEKRNVVPAALEEESNDPEETAATPRCSIRAKYHHFAHSEADPREQRWKQSIFQRIQLLLLVMK